MAELAVKSRESCRWDCVALGEVMLRLDPGDMRVHTAREFRVWEGGGEYNVARGLRRCFGLNTAVVTALADNPVGRLVEDLMLQGGVEQSREVGASTTASAARCATASTSPSAASACAPRLASPIAATRPCRSSKPGDIDFEDDLRPPGRALVPHRRHLLRRCRRRRRWSPKRRWRRRGNTAP